ncbi:adenosine deaminase [Thalassotalea sp. ND16A]|uniref:adenosine deaminase n=1 Tax=Thalassotalea sp. ND16A TaxID=1535422 RepID=UPI00051A5B48|nr:adenosine deaminase [Thalassotalea sp. ND16A]KGJ98416.1 Adenosine deaminase [Thalassotalea sp. ND16A]
MVFDNLPLIDLHRHLDGNIRPDTIWDLAQQNGIALPVEHFNDFIPHVRIEDKASDLMEFLAKLDWGVKVLANLEDVQRVAFENVEDLSLAGIDYAELRFSPYYMAMSHNLPTADVVAAVIAGVKQGCSEFNVQANLIGILSRTFGLEKCQHELDSLLVHKDNLVAIDLAGDELGQPAELFEQQFKQVDKAGLNVTVHAGEAAGPESVWQAIKLLKATRIGHGVRSYQDPALLEYLATNNITLETCLTSNYQTGTIANIADHPIHTFLANGVKVCLNTDDPAVEGIELRHEYHIAKTTLGLTDKQLQDIQLNALHAAFISDAEKQALLKLKSANI